MPIESGLIEQLSCPLPPRWGFFSRHPQVLQQPCQFRLFWNNLLQAYSESHAPCYHGGICQQFGGIPNEKNTAFVRITVIGTDLDNVSKQHVIIIMIILPRTFTNIQILFWSSINDVNILQEYSRVYKKISVCSNIICNKAQCRQ